MPGKILRKPRKTAAKTAANGATSAGGAPVGADQYIAEQLRAMYDAVVLQPIPDRLLKLLDRLDKGAEK